MTPDENAVTFDNLFLIFFLVHWVPTKENIHATWYGKKKN